MQQRFSFDLVRRSNLSWILKLLHREGPLSRSAITRQTGLSRSTVGALIADLAEAGLVTESAPTRTTVQVGRPSPIISIAPNLLAVVAQVHPGEVRVGLCSMGGSLVRHESRSLPAAASPEAVVAAIADQVAELTTDRPASASEDRLVGVTVAVRGWVDPLQRTVSYSSELDWRDVDLADAVNAATGLPTTLAYTTQLVAVAEGIWGTAKGRSHLVYLFGSSDGIGSAAVLDGALIRGSAGLGVRLGHLFVAPDGPPCRCGEVGCLMMAVTEAGLLQHTHTPSGDVDQLEQALRSDSDPDLADELARDLRYLQLGLRSITTTFDPDAIMLGGYLAALLRVGRGLLELGLTDAVARQVRRSPELLEPSPGADQVLIGASHQAFGDLLDDPIGLLGPTSVIR